METAAEEIKDKGNPLDTDEEEGNLIEIHADDIESGNIPRHSPVFHDQGQYI